MARRTRTHELTPGQRLFGGIALGSFLLLCANFLAPAIGLERDASIALFSSGALGTAAIAFGLTPGRNGNNREDNDEPRGARDE